MKVIRIGSALGRTVAAGVVAWFAAPIVAQHVGWCNNGGWCDPGQCIIHPNGPTDGCNCCPKHGVWYCCDNVPCSQCDPMDA